ncbi:unnamed protein product [Nezara viridula]|uniref:Uncharacterized protein n=1 Tax=Nezara viridula TaxID=85310 RepID=A0A9P0E4U2_NEZVI|nr:unnamed protein product [Nezara viridula]
MIRRWRLQSVNYTRLRVISQIKRNCYRLAEDASDGCQ